MGREDELFDKYMLIRQMTEAVRNKNMAATGPLGDTTRGRGRVLALLKQKDGISTKDMATIMGIRVSSLNEVLGKMEKEGYVERTASPDDRRVMLVWLTDKGKAIELPDQKLPQILFGTLSQGSAKPALHALRADDRIAARGARGRERGGQGSARTADRVLRERSPGAKRKAAGTVRVTGASVLGTAPGTGSPADDRALCAPHASRQHAAAHRLAHACRWHGRGCNAGHRQHPHGERAGRE